MPFYYLLFARFHEFEIRKQCPEVFVIRKTLTEMANDARLDEVGSISIIYSQKSIPGDATVCVEEFVLSLFEQLISGETTVGGRN